MDLNSDTSILSVNPTLNSFFKMVLKLILEREWGIERQKEKHWYAPDWGDKIHNLGICPDLELNPQIFWYMHNAPTNEAILNSTSTEKTHGGNFYVKFSTRA